MKGFSEALENICAYTDAAFECYELKDFATITVEPVPLIKDMPDKLLNGEFCKALEVNDDYHQKRIEREGRG